MFRISALAISGVLATGLLVGTAQAGDYGDNHRGDRMEHRDHDRDYGDRHHLRHGGKVVIGLGEDGIYIDKRRRHHHHDEHHHRHHHDHD